jgi:hypothetical protein
VPYDVAFGLEDAERIAHVVAFGMLAGLAFDWKRLSWSEAMA